MAHVAFRLNTTLLVVVNIQLVFPSSSSFSFVCSPSFFFFLFLFSLFLICCLDYSCTPLGPFVLCGSCSLILCVLTSYMQTLIFELMSIRHWQQIKGPTIQNFKFNFSGLCLVYWLRSTSQNFELYFIGLCLVHSSGQPISLVQPMGPIILILLFL